MASLYSNIGLLINKLRGSYLGQHQDPGFVVKPFQYGDWEWLTFKDEFPTLQNRAYSPPISFSRDDIDLKIQVPPLELNLAENVVSSTLNLPSTLNNTLSLSQTTILLLSSQAAPASTLQSDSRRSSSNNLIKTNFNRLFKAKTGDAVLDEDASDSENDNEYDMDRASDDNYDIYDNDKISDYNSLHSDYEAGQDDIKIDHDDIGGQESLQREILDDEFDGDEDHSNFLTDSDLTDSDAFLLDDSLYGSDISLFKTTTNHSQASESKRHLRAQTGEKALRKRTPQLADSMKNEQLNLKTILNKKLSKSFSNLLTAGQRIIEDEPIVKKEPIKPVLKSNLTAILNESSTISSTRVLEYFKFVGETTGQKPVSIKVYVPDFAPDKAVDLKIARQTLVKDLIGFILFNLDNESKAFLNNNPQLINPNYWCLRIVEDDGEIDDDFGPLDRNKPILGYGINEVLLQKVSLKEFKQNELRFPQPKVFEKFENSLNTAESSTHKRLKSLIPEEVDPDSDTQITVPSKATNLLHDKFVEDSEQETKKTTKPSKSSSFKAKSMILPNSLRASSRVSSSLNQQQLFYNLTNNNNGSTNRLTTSSFLKWTVWRHHQLAFKNRSERSLSIDGEYIYIIPDSVIPDHDKVAYKYLVDANNTKTTSFHVSQIVKCKQSKKYPANLKIVVMKPAGLKRYDLEALDPIQCQEIVRLINTLIDAYAVSK